MPEHHYVTCDYCEAIWIRKRAPHTMNRDEGAHYLSHIYDPLLMSSTSSRAPPCGDRPKQKLDQPSQFWWSALPESTKLSIVSQLFGFGKWISILFSYKPDEFIQGST